MIVISIKVKRRLKWLTLRILLTKLLTNNIDTKIINKGFGLGHKDNQKYGNEMIIIEKASYEGIKPRKEDKPDTKILLFLNLGKTNS